MEQEIKENQLDGSKNPNKSRKEQNFLQTNYKYLIITFAASLVIVFLISYFWAKEYFLVILGLVAASEIFLFAYYGLLGPKWLREKMQKLNIWAESSNAVFFWFNPYKPIQKSIEVVDNPQQMFIQIIKGVTRIIFITFTFIIFLIFAWIMVAALISLLST